MVEKKISIEIILKAFRDADTYSDTFLKGMEVRLDERVDPKILSDVLFEVESCPGELKVSSFYAMIADAYWARLMPFFKTLPRMDDDSGKIRYYSFEADKCLSTAIAGLGGWAPLCSAFIKDQDAAHSLLRKHIKTSMSQEYVMARAEYLRGTNERNRSWMDALVLTPLLLWYNDKGEAKGYFRSMTLEEKTLSGYVEPVHNESSKEESDPWSRT